MLGLQPHDQVEQLRADRDVERRDRLVRDDQPRSQGERAGEADPLPLAAGELARQLSAGADRHSHLPEQLGDPLIAFGLGERPLDNQRFGQDGLHAHPGVERGVGVLEDHLQVAALGSSCPAP
jgi:hypothetical protein